MQRQLLKTLNLCKALSVNLFVKKTKMHGLMVLISILVGLPLILSGCSDDHSNSSAPALTVIGIDYSPNSFELDGEVVGFDADTARLAMTNAGIAAEFSMSDSFEDAYQATLVGPNRALLSVTYTEDRKDLFKWAGPTSKGNFDVFVKASSGIDEGIGVEASKSLESIAVVGQGWKETTILEGLGFQNLRYYGTYEAAISAFKNDEVTAMASDRAQFVEAVSFSYYRQENIGVACIYHGSYYFIAFSKDVDDQVVQRCQDAIDGLVTDGTLLEIYRDYVPYAVEEMVPSLIQLHTEINPPYGYMTSYSVEDWGFAGSSVEIVNEIQAQNSYKNPINITSWVAGYQALQFMPNYALFTTARTPEREDLFQWVGPIVSFTDHFYTLTASNFQVSTLDQARALGSVATPPDWYSHDYLMINGFDNILTTANTSEDAFDQLISGEADALLLPDTMVKWFCEQKGISPTDLTAQLEGDYYEGYIAFSLNTPASVVNEWQNNLDAMKADGRFQAIWDRWYEGIESP
jgi:polar amino acid transport system substrate-binding protein